MVGFAFVGVVFRKLKVGRLGRFGGNSFGVGIGLEVIVRVIRLGGDSYGVGRLGVGRLVGDSLGY